MSLAADIPGSDDGIGEAVRLVEHARTAEEARRRLSVEVAELMNRLQAEEERVAALEQQLEQATAARERATRAENELTAVRLNVRILEDELRAIRAQPGVSDGVTAASPAQVVGVEHEQLRSEHAQLRAEHARLQDEHARLRDDHAETSARLEAEGRTLREVEAARAAADAFAADTSRDLGEAMGDLIEARELVASLQAQLTGLRSEHDQLVQAHEALRVRAAAEQELAERNLAEQRRAHDTLRAEAVVAFEQRLQEMSAAHERALLEAEARAKAAEARAQEVALALQAMTHDRDQVQAGLDKAQSAIAVAHQRLREEVEARTAADERRSLLEDELTYLRAEVFAPGQAASQKLGLRGRRGRRSPSPTRAEPPATVPTASETATDAAPPGPPQTAAEDRDTALERRLFGS